MRQKCTYSELFWTAFFRIRTEYGEIRSISPHLVRIRENVDQNNSEYRHFSRSVNNERLGKKVAKLTLKFYIRLLNLTVIWFKYLKNDRYK